MTKPIKIENPEGAELVLRGHPNGGWTVETRDDGPYLRQTLAAYGSADAMLADLARVLVKPDDHKLSEYEIDFIKRNSLAPMRNLRGATEPERQDHA